MQSGDFSVSSCSLREFWNVIVCNIRDSAATLVLASLDAREPPARYIQYRDDNSEHDVEQRKSPPLFRGDRHKGGRREPLRVDTPVPQEPDGDGRGVNDRNVQQVVVDGERPRRANHVFIEVQDIDALHDRIKTQAPIVMAIHTQWYGMREFAITDPDGYVITFAQRVQNA